jgi:hypothetical protein
MMEWKGGKNIESLGVGTPVNGHFFLLSFFVLFGCKKIRSNNSEFDGKINKI